MIKVTNLSVRYTAAPILSELSFSLGKGERAALLGANGAGKSTLLLSLVGVLPAEKGEIELCGLPLSKKTLPELRSKAGLLFQNPDDQLFMTTVWEDILFGPLNAAPPIDLPSIERRADDVLEKLGLSHLKDRQSHKLSGGEKRLAALASLLVMDPDVLLLDEPTAFLDPRGRRSLLEILASLPQTMLIATHDLDFAARLASRALLLSKGCLAADEGIKAVLEDEKLLLNCGL